MRIAIQKVGRDLEGTVGTLCYSSRIKRRMALINKLSSAWESRVYGLLASNFHRHTIQLHIMEQVNGKT